MAKILVDYGDKKRLAKTFGVSEVTIRSALAYRTKSELSVWHSLPGIIQ
jgi:hypothetical protein